MRKLTGLFTAAALLTSSISTAFAGDPSYYAYGKVASGYIFGDQGAVVCKDANISGGLTATWENGVTLGMWAGQNLSVHAPAKDSCAEIDPIVLGWSGLCGRVTCFGELAYYMEPTIGSTKNDIVRLRGGVRKDYTLERFTLGWYAGADHFVFFNGPDSQVLRLGGSASIALGDGWSIGGSTGVGYNTHPGDTTIPIEGGFTKQTESGWNFSPLYVESFIPLNTGRSRLTVVSVRIGKAFN